MGRLRWFLLGFSVGMTSGSVIVRFALDSLLEFIRKYVG